MSFKYTYFKYCPSLYLYIKYEALTLFLGCVGIKYFVGCLRICIAEGEFFCRKYTFYQASILKELVE